MCVCVCVCVCTHARTHAYRIMDTVRRSTLQNIILLLCLLQERCLLIVVHFIKPICVFVGVCVTATAWLLLVPSPIRLHDKLELG
jgi:hypothetical protein